MKAMTEQNAAAWAEAAAIARAGQWARWTGLPAGLPVAMVIAALGAVEAPTPEPGQLGRRPLDLYQAPALRVWADDGAAVLVEWLDPPCAGSVAELLAALGGADREGAGRHLRSGATTTEYVHAARGLAVTVAASYEQPLSFAQRLATVQLFAATDRPRSRRDLPRLSRAARRAAPVGAAAPGGAGLGAHAAGGVRRGAGDHRPRRCARMATRAARSPAPGRCMSGGRAIVGACGRGRQGPNRVNRGGSWNSDARNVRAANRNANAPDNANDNLGLRLAGAQTRVGWPAPDQTSVATGGPSRRRTPPGPRRASSGSGCAVERSPGLRIPARGGRGECGRGRGGRGEVRS